VLHYLVFLLVLALPGAPDVALLSADSPAEMRRCEVPIPWSVERIDERFGVTAQEVEDAVRQAGMLWGEAVGGRLLFREDAAEGGGRIAVRFIFDERAEMAFERRNRERGLSEDGLRIEASRAALDSIRSDLDGFRIQQAEANRAYLERMSEYNRLVAALNAGGGVAPAMNARLSEMVASLEEEQRQVVVLTEEFNRLVEATNARANLLNAEVAAYNAGREAFQRDFGETGVVSSAYQESRRGIGPFTTSLTRAIEIYHFEDRTDLVLLLAREMGRALGLELTTEPGSVMSGTAPRDGGPALHPSDLAALRAHCPEL